MIATRPSGFEELYDVLADADEPLTAREILDRLREREVDAFDSSYRVATVLGKIAERGGPVVVVEGSPYRYRVEERD
jgi:predicted Zn-ribbon and HTH transcriptional regulator